MTIEEQLHEALAASVSLAVERDDLRATVEKLTIGTADELSAAKADIVAKDARLGELTVAVDGLSAEVVTLKATLAALEAGTVSASKEACPLSRCPRLTPRPLPPKPSTMSPPSSPCRSAPRSAPSISRRTSPRSFAASFNLSP
jgi:hypothetical protein